MARVALVAVGAIMLIIGLTVPASAGSLKEPGVSDDRTSRLPGSCGSTYRHVGHYPIRDGASTLAHLDVYWSWADRRNCLKVNHAGPTYGIELYTEARVRPSGAEWPDCPASEGCDAGFYRFYAGPVFTPTDVDMTGRCIDVSGAIDWTTRTMEAVHCGPHVPQV